MKKIVAICLAVIILITSSIFIFSAGNSFGGTCDSYAYGDAGRSAQLPNVMALSEATRTFDPVEAGWLSNNVSMPSTNSILYGQTPREGYVLAPSMFGLSGIDPQSLFVLQTPADYTNLPSITIDGQPEPIITREDDRTFIVAPSVPLTSNSVYIFRLNRTNANNGADITWAFQTTVRFEISSTLPRNQATNVPVRTGIEIAFSFGDEINYSELSKAPTRLSPL